VTRQITARAATAQMIAAATAFAGISAATQITRSADLPSFRMTKLLSVILDSPAHMSR
jgi:hypothetical protein